MSSPTIRPPNIPVPAAAAAAPASGAAAASAAAVAPAPVRMPTPDLLAAMLRTSAKVSDLFFSPGKPPLVEINGKLASAGAPRPLTAEDTRRIASDLIGNNLHAIENLKKLGSCDVSYSLPGLTRFRVNIFMQRGTCAVVMRVIPGKIPDFDTLNLPSELGKIVGLRNGIVLVTGPTGSGKSSTLAAIIDRINREQFYHVLTIEDPIEFLHPHKNCIVHQRELHSDTPSFALALRAALRQAPKVILVGEMRDRETIEIAMEAAETGHLVLSTLHTIDASKTVERILGAFPMDEQHTLRNRLAKSFRYIISQRLIPRKDGAGRIAAIEILKSTLRTRDYVEKGEGEGKTLLDAMRVGDQEGMQHFDGEIEKLIREGIIDLETGLAYATNSSNLQLELADLSSPQADSLLETSAT
ncbi:MAG TPA: PilT/PilU family type 4a pilus ATPase [Candidatus Acidoferrales bacterium]|jgi:twitching motility protein PilT|nr:PilT/PilU family type 4a pilus ATPase [Candidatus Acidoferrales bacterium]